MFGLGIVPIYYTAISPGGGGVITIDDSAIWSSQVVVGQLSTVWDSLVYYTRSEYRMFDGWTSHHTHTSSVCVLCDTSQLESSRQKQASCYRAHKTLDPPGYPPVGRLGEGGGTSFVRCYCHVTRCHNSQKTGTPKRCANGRHLQKTAEWNQPWRMSRDSCPGET